ncbi:MAG: DUF481 domain-containing protein [Cellvibrionaceae bacterium]|nr:DUF481 domain-containing protein [Cellvibrionaceae bacterium]MCV6625084.1 DUF481 domain-containing protein [Cellvibrionaceae bacterium]
MLRLICFVLTLVCSQSLWAGRVVLNNGDSLQGELLGIEAQKLRWRSPVLGELSIELDKIDSFNSSTLVKISGHQGPCTVLGVEAKQLSYSCEDNGHNLTELSALQAITPYEDHFNAGVELNAKLGLAGVLSRGNKDEDDWDLNGQLEAKHGDYRHQAGFNYDYTDKLAQAARIEDYKLDYQLDWFFKERWFLYGDISHEMLESKNIDQRSGLGLGVGYQVYQRQDLSLALETGLNGRRERQRNVEDSDQHLNWQWALNLKWQLLERATLFHKQKLSYSLQTSEDWELDTQTGLDIPLGYGLSTALSFDYDYDQLPAQGAQKKDTRLTIGLAYQW